MISFVLLFIACDTDYVHSMHSNGILFYIQVYTYLLCPGMDGLYTCIVNGQYNLSVFSPICMYCLRGYTPKACDKLHPFFGSEMYVICFKLKSNYLFHQIELKASGAAHGNTQKLMYKPTDIDWCLLPYVSCIANTSVKTKTFNEKHQSSFANKYLDRMVFFFLLKKI